MYIGYIRYTHSICFILSSLTTGYLWPPNSAGHYTFLLWFLSSFFLSFCGLSANLECRSEMCCMRLKYRTQKSPSAHHRTTLSGYIFAIKACIDNRKNLLNSNISATCYHNMNFSPLTAEICSFCWRVWVTPTHFNGFRVLPSLLHRRRLTEVNKTLQDVWPCPGLWHTIYTFGGSCPLT